jgi:cation diffusion facilitator CzcD-associated flavoprotein CzcO
VIGAGPGGLAVSRQLRSHGVDHVVLERGDTVGHTWANLYDSLVLHTGRHLSALPGLPLPAGTPLFPPRTAFLDYLKRYTDHFGLPVRTGHDVRRVERIPPGWSVTTRVGSHRARALVIATGIVANPHRPGFPGEPAFRGRVLHSIEYRRPAPFAGRRVLVVGAGNSAGEIAAELAGSGVSVSLAVRSGARVVPREVFGLPIQYVAWCLASMPAGAQRAIAQLVDRAGRLARGPAVLPQPTPSNCPDIPLIGFHLVDAVRAGRIVVKPGLEAFDAAGVRFTDGTSAAFDDVILATGFRAATAVLGNLIDTDECGFARRRGRVISADQPDLYFIGHNYDARGGLYNISRDAVRIGRLLSAKRPARPSSNASSVV